MKGVAVSSAFVVGWLVSDPSGAASRTATSCSKNALDKTMLALVNRVPSKEPSGDPSRGDVAAKIAILDRAEKSDEIVGFGAFDVAATPTDFVPERVLWSGEDPKIMVRVHHKFVVIDAEGQKPVVYTGSANFSGNPLHSNDENLLEITEWPRVAAMYMAEFLPLYEHYRARVKSEDPKTFKLTPTMPGAESTSSRALRKRRRARRWPARSRHPFCCPAGKEQLPTRSRKAD